MNFTNKETYLQYRQHWKLNFFAAISSVRQAKKNLRMADSVYGKEPTGANWDKIYYARRAVSKSHELIRDMLTELAAAKKLAHQQWQANLNKVT